MSLGVRGPGYSGAALRASETAFERGVSRLSSGLRIQRAADDAAGLTISERMRSQISGSAMATRNVHDGINLLQTAEGGLGSITSMLQRLRELSVQAANTGVMTQADRDAAAAEVGQLVAELDRTAGTTSFNGQRMLDGSRPGGFVFQVGAGAGDTLTASAYDMGSDALRLTGATGTVSSLATVNTYETVSDKLAMFDTTAGRNVFSFSLDGGAVRTFAVPEGVYATEAERKNLRLLLQTGLATAGVPVTVQIKMTGGGGRSSFTFTATDGPTTRIDVTGTGDTALGIDTNIIGTTSTPVTTTFALDSLVDLVSRGSGDAITLIDEALETVLGARSELGATQNRLEHRLGILASTEQNLSAARSQITDADVAKEWAGVVRAQVLSQAGTAMQAQASSGGQRVLQLLSSLA